MDAGGGRMNSCYNAMETIDNKLSFTNLLSLVAHEAEKQKGPRWRWGSKHDQLLVHSLEDVCTQHNDDAIIDWNETNLNNAEADGIKNDSMFPVVQTAGQEKNKEINFSSKLPDESIDTCLFEDSSLICGSGNGLGDMVKSNGIRSYSTFNNYEEDCATMDVTSQNKEYIGGPIEESMRKYCEDKKRVMFKPEVGMEFSSTEEAYQYYNMYSWVAGFSIRLGDNYTNKKKERTMQEYLCQRQGNDNETKNSTTSSLGCVALESIQADYSIIVTMVGLILLAQMKKIQCAPSTSCVMSGFGKMSLVISQTKYSRSTVRMKKSWRQR